MNIRQLTFVALLGFFVIFILGINLAGAEDLILTGKVSSVTIAKDKNGAEYVRATIQEERSIQGVKYSSGTAVMFFGDQVKDGKTLKEGDAIHAVANKRIYQGNPSYTVMKVLPPAVK